MLRGRLAQISLTTSLVVMVLGGLVFLGFVYYTAQAQADAKRDSRLVLCLEIEKLKAIERFDLGEKIVQSREYLVDHPQGAPGISRELIERAIASNERKLALLSAIDCERFASLKPV